MRRTPGRFDYRIYVSRLTPAGWTEPVFASFSGKERDDAPYLSPDGQRIVFDSSRPAPGLAPNSINLWLADRTPTGWSAPRLLRAPSRNEDDEPVPGRDEFGPVLDRNGTLHFYSFRRPYRAGRRYIALPPAYDTVQLAPQLPDPSDATFVGYFGFATDERLAVLEGRSRTGRDTDLYFTRRQADGSWSDPAPIPGVNTRANEGVPYLTTDGQFLLFTSNRRTTPPGTGNANLYIVRTDGLFPGKE